MKRVLWIFSGLVLAVGLVWLVGRPPSDAALEDACRAFQERRRARLEALLSEEARGRDVSREILQLLDAHHRFRRRGWEVVLLPPSASRPDPEDFWVAGRFPVGADRLDARLQGPMEVWMRARGPWARLIDRISSG